jgi:hypothetical protein
MNSEKQHTPNRGPTTIRLKPSTTDYATFAITTARAMGVTEPLVPRTKPNKRVLWLANSKS